MERRFGYVKSPSDLRDYRVYGIVSNVQLPSEYTLPKAHIKDQGEVNSCVAHSLSSLLEIKTEVNFSTGWIYGYRPEDYYQGEGMCPRDALKTLQTKGAVQNNDFDYNIEMQVAKELVDRDKEHLERLASSCKITAYAKLSSIEEIKSWLYTKQMPVPMAIATSGITLDEHNIIQIPDHYPNSGHAMLIIGWNEQGFILQNSWGTSWGDEGIAILPYEYTIAEAWGVTFDLDKQNISKPKLHCIRSVAQKVINFFKER